MSQGFKGFADDPNKDGNIRFNINADEIDNIIRSYKKLKKYQKSSIHQIEKLSGIHNGETEFKYGIDVQDYISRLKL